MNRDGGQERRDNRKSGNKAFMNKEGNRSWKGIGKKTLCKVPYDECDHYVYHNGPIIK